MGKRNRLRISHIRQGIEPSHVEKLQLAKEMQKLDALEQIADQYGGEAVAKVLRELGVHNQLRWH